MTQRPVFLWSAGAFLLSIGPVQADRVIFSPHAESLNPNSLRLQGIFSPGRHDENRLWFQMTSPEGIELELNRNELALDFKKRYSFNVQYPLFPDTTRIPAISFGVRDLFGTGLERRSVYAVLGKSLPLSDRQAHLFRSIYWNVGAGTGYMFGLFGSLEARFQAGLTLQAEIFRNRFNFGAAYPVVRNLQAQIHSIDGDVYYGLSYGFAW